MKKISQKNLIEFFGFASRNTLVEWDNSEKRKVLAFVQEYLTNEDIEEFIETNRVSKFDLFDETLEIYLFVMSEVFQDCRKIALDKRESFIYLGKYLATIYPDRIKEKYIEFIQFIDEEDEIYNKVIKGFTRYLLDNNISNHLKHVNEINNYYNSLSSKIHKFFFIRNFIWIFMPLPSQISKKELNSLFSSLPSFLNKFPIIKLILNFCGRNGIIGMINDKFFLGKKE